MCAHANEILQRDFALKTIWIDDNYFNARSMDVYITKLRKHLKEDESIEIINIHGKGYKLITPDGEGYKAIRNKKNMFRLFILMLSITFVSYSFIDNNIRITPPTTNAAAVSKIALLLTFL